MTYESVTEITTGFTKDGTFVIKLNTVFDFTIAQQFHSSYDQVTNADKFTLDFSEIKHVNPVSLGMLLEMYEVITNKNEKPINIINLDPEIKKQLVRLRMDELFDF